MLHRDEHTACHAADERFRLRIIERGERHETECVACPSDTRRSNGVRTSCRVIRLGDTHILEDVSMTMPRQIDGAGRAERPRQLEPVVVVADRQAATAAGRIDFGRRPGGRYVATGGVLARDGERLPQARPHRRQQPELIGRLCNSSAEQSRRPLPRPSVRPQHQRAMVAIAFCQDTDYMQLVRIPELKYGRNLPISL